MLKFLKNPLVLILALAAFLRLFMLTSVPPSLNWDEVSMGYTAYSLSQTGMDEWGQRLPLLFRSYGEWKSAVYIYLLVPMVKFFGMNAWSVRLPSAIAGILAVYLTYLIGKKIYSEKVGLWSAFFLAISPWHLLLSRPAFEANVSLTLILAGLYLFLRFNLESKVYLLISSAIALGLAPHTYNSAKVVVPILALYLIWSTKLHKNLKQLVIFLGVLTLFAAPLFIDLFSGRSQFRYSQVGVSTDIKGLNEFINYRKNPHLPPIVGKLLFNRYTYSLSRASYNGLSYFNPAFLLVEAGDHNQHHVRNFGVLYVAEFIFVLSGLLTLFSKKSRLINFLPLVIIGLGIIPAALTRDQGHVLRSLLTLPGWQLLAGLGIASLQPSKFKKCLLCLLIVQAFIFMLAYFIWYPQTFARDWQYGHKEVAGYLRLHENEYDKIVMTKWYGEAQLFLAFYNKWDPLRYQQDNIPNLRYESEGKIWLDQLPEYSLGKYTFKYLNWQAEDKSEKTLYIGKGDDFYIDSKIVKTINFPDGTPAFVLVEP
ncbi:MAG: glycosyltransferase family 39 protein [bacterium]